MLFASFALGAPAKKAGHHHRLALSAADDSALSQQQQQRTYDFWETRSRNRQLGQMAKQSSQAISLHEETGSSDPCQTWCYGDVAVSHDGQHAFPPRVTYPSDDGEVADWLEKCSWDNFCGGCPECATLDRTFETLTHENAYLDCGGVGCHGDCNTMCEVISDDGRAPHVDPVWKNETRGWSELCNWGPCHGCGECLTAATPTVANTDDSSVAATDSEQQATHSEEASAQERTAEKQAEEHTAEAEEREQEHEAEERKQQHDKEVANEKRDAEEVAAEKNYVLQKDKQRKEYEEMRERDGKLAQAGAKDAVKENEIWHGIGTAEAEQQAKAEEAQQKRWGEMRPHNKHKAEAKKKDAEAEERRDVHALEAKKAEAKEKAKQREKAAAKEEKAALKAKAEQKEKAEAKRSEKMHAEKVGKLNAKPKGNERMKAQAPKGAANQHDAKGGKAKADAKTSKGSKASPK